MDIDIFLAGFAQALNPTNLLFALIGSLLGTLVGVLPGIGATAGIAILLPLTSFLEPAPAIIMLAAIYYGAMYGGSTSAILVNIPGEVGSVVTALDGYAMAKQGRAGPALAISAISSFVAGTLGVMALSLFAVPLASIALKVGPPEYFGLMFVAMTIIVGLSGASLIKGFISAAFGVLIAMVGLDAVTGRRRFTLGITDLYGGIDFIAVIIGLFAIAEVLKNVSERTQAIYGDALGRLLPSRREIWECMPAILRSTAVGFGLGILPGCTPGVVSFISYEFERAVSPFKKMFGKGAIQGVAAPEGANNAATSGGFVPLLSLGIPPTPALAVLLSGLMIYGLQPGPMLFKEKPLFVWTIIASMYIGNVMLLILNLPLIGLWARVVRVPYYIMGPLILILSVVGAFSIRNSMFDVWMALLFGLIGFLMAKVRIPATPMVLALVLTPLVENSLTQSIAMAAGSPILLFTRPGALGLIVVGIVVLVLSLLARRRRKLEVIT